MQYYIDIIVNNDNWNWWNIITTVKLVGYDKCQNINITDNFQKLEEYINCSDIDEIL